MCDFITAKEARSYVNNINSKKVQEELNLIEQRIKNAMDKGKFSVKIYRKFLDSTVNFLKEKGYKVKYWCGSQWNPANDTTIFW